MAKAPGEPAEVLPNPFPKLPHQFGDHYILKKRIGNGGVGVVYEAEEPHLDRTVAIKVPLQGANCFQEVRKLFSREARLLSRFAQLATSNICQIHAAGEIDKCPYVAMEYIPGQTLTQYWQANRKQLGPSGAADLICHIARIVGRVHKLKYRNETIIHRDLKPGNILISPVPGETEPRIVLLDFGFAFNIALGHPLTTKDVAGTAGYMPPEQLNFGWEGCEISERSDVYSLGVVLYQLLTNEMPFDGDTFYSLADKVMRTAAPAPSLKHPVFAPFDPICKKAMARHPNNRYASMEEFADALVDALIELQSPRKASPKGASMTPQTPIPRESIHYAFVPLGYTAPQSLIGLDRLFLDVGNRLAEGVIDHHHGSGGPTTRLVRDRPELIDAALAPMRDPGDPFTIVMHQYPDLDAVSSAAMVVKYLTARVFPTQADALIRYVERSDAGESCVSPQQPFTLYSAFMRLVSRNLANTALAPEERWRTTVKDGITLINFALGEAERTNKPLEAIDPFTAAIFTRDDRDAVFSDANRYKAKLDAKETHARRCRFRFTRRADPPGGDVVVEGLIVRNVQNATDPNRVAFFKDWARGDAVRSRDGQDFAALSVFMPEEIGHKRRCVLSITPGCGASLKGLGKLLDEAESAKRVELHRVDDRKADPVTGELLPLRPGYDNSDPWYDGRGHDYTIVDSPRSGTVLTADEIEKIFLDFGRATEIENVIL